MRRNYFRVITVKELTLSCYIVVVVMVNVLAVARDQRYCRTVWDLDEQNKIYS